MHFIEVCDNKRERMNKRTDKHDVADHIFSYLMLVPSFKILHQVVPEKSLTENFVKKKNE